jgi:hypothetical protein
VKIQHLLSNEDADIPSYQGCGHVCKGLIITERCDKLIYPIARQWFDFFLPNEQNFMQVNLEGIPLQGYYQYTPAENFPLTIEEAEQLAGLQIHPLITIQPGLRFLRTRYEANLETAILYYERAEYN